MRLFSAVWLPEPVGEHAERAVRGLELPAWVRPVPAHKWHLTLAFYGDDASLPERAAHLDRLAGLAAPALRLAGGGTFAGVLWIGVRPVTAADGQALAALAGAAGAHTPYRPHLTVARWRRAAPDRVLAQRLAGYQGPAWVPTSVDLVRSDPGARYTTVHSAPLISW
jgi:2'-5' RNA ligase